VAKRRVKRDVQSLFNDPLWPKQWYLVSMCLLTLHYHNHHHVHSIKYETVICNNNNNNTCLMAVCPGLPGLMINNHIYILYVDLSTNV